MTLRKQLIIISLCLLALPWAGCQYVKEMELVLQKNQQQLLQSSATPIAQLIAPIVSEHEMQADITAPILYAPYRDSPIALDGYDDEWKDFQKHKLSTLSQLSDTKSRTLDSHKKTTVSEDYFSISKNKDNLLLFLSIKDDHIIYHHPSTPSPTYNDFIQITTGGEKDQQNIIFYTSGQGAIQAAISNNSFPLRWKTLPPTKRIQGYWQETSTGYNIELNIPLSLIKQQLELTVFDVDKPPSNSRHLATPIKTSFTKHLLFPLPALRVQLSPFMQPNWDIAIFEKHQWPLSPQIPQDIPNRVEGMSQTELPLKPSSNTTMAALWESALGRFYRYVTEIVSPSNALPTWPLEYRHLSLSKQQIPLDLITQQSSQWYRVKGSQRSILTVVKPIYDIKDQHIIGHVVVTQSSDSLLSLTNNALLRVVNLSLITASSSALILLGFASLLSYRIRRLRNLTELAVTKDGKVSPFSASTMSDEIGDLSRSYASLLHRINDYNEYLETLSGKLAHELRTPLTISKSSIEMLKMVDPTDSEKYQRYLSRAEEGLERLRLILASMSEASRVEQIIQHCDAVQFDLSALTNDICQAYQDSYPSFRFEFLPDQQLSHSNTTLQGSPELIAQMLDKLVDNATGFAPTDSTISLSLRPTPEGIRLTVANTGPLLPENMKHQLFDSMISVRAEKTEKPHLGLGLYIVKLIAQHHNGRLSAQDNPEMNGVEFHVDLPTR